MATSEATTTPAAAPARLVYRLNDLAGLFGVSRRTLERERSAGKFPPPDFHVGRAPIWKAATVDRWIEAGGSK